MGLHAKHAGGGDGCESLDAELIAESRELLSADFLQRLGHGGALLRQGIPAHHHEPLQQNGTTHRHLGGVERGEGGGAK